MNTLEWQKTKDKLEKTSPCFCLAKWNQVTLHLNNGTTHSCHNCWTHPVPLTELKNNPSALHNTEHKKKMRKLMLEGKRPEECDYCWRVEDLKDESLFSDRIKKSTFPWNDPEDMENIPKMPWDANVSPRSIEVDFSSACNFKCVYCGPRFSTTWMKEIKEFGPYKAGDITFNPIAYNPKFKGYEDLPLEEENNPYIEAFWKWLPEMIKDLRVLRITGGEPLLSKNTFKVMDYLIKNPQPKLEFHINSNLGAPAQHIDTLIVKINEIQKTLIHGKPVRIYTSGEGHGKKGEYIRNGLNYKYWLDNLDKVLTNSTKVRITIMVTYNALCITSFTDLLKDVLALKQKFASSTNNAPIEVNVPYLRAPEFLAAWILPESYISFMEESLAFMKANEEVITIEDNKKNLKTPGFTIMEIHDMERALEVIKKAILQGAGRTLDLDVLRRSFHFFVDELDTRRDTSFLGTFPEMTEFYHYCKNEYP